MPELSGISLYSPFVHQHLSCPLVLFRWDPIIIRSGYVPNIVLEMARLCVRILPESIKINMALKLALDVDRAIPREQQCCPQVHLSKLLFITTSYFVRFCQWKQFQRSNRSNGCFWARHKWCCIPERICLIELSSDSFKSVLFLNNTVLLNELIDRMLE